MTAQQKGIYLIPSLSAGLPKPRLTVTCIFFQEAINKKISSHCEIIILSGKNDLGICLSSY